MFSCNSVGSGMMMVPLMPDAVSGPANNRIVGGAGTMPTQPVVPSMPTQTGLPQMPTVPGMTVHGPDCYQSKL